MTDRLTSDQQADDSSDRLARLEARLASLEAKLSVYLESSPTPPPLPTEKPAPLPPVARERETLSAAAAISVPMTPAGLAAIPFAEKADEPEESPSPESINPDEGWTVLEREEAFLASASPPPVPVAEKKRGNLEKQIGQKWLLLAGVGILLLGGVFFLKHAYDQGWIVPTPPIRCLIAAAIGFVMIGVGEWSHRRDYRYFTAGMFAGGVVWLYLTTWAGSPNGLWPDWSILSAPVAFGAMCAITIGGVALSLRANLLTCAILSLLGAFATPILLSSGQNRQLELFAYLLLVDVGFLVVALRKNWRSVAPLALAGTVFLLGGWVVRYGTDPSSSQGLVIAFGWLYFAAFAAGSIGFHWWTQRKAAASVEGKASAMQAVIRIGMFVVAVALLPMLWVASDASSLMLRVNLLALNVVIIAVCWRSTGRWTAFLAWAMVLGSQLLALDRIDYDHTPWPFAAYLVLVTGGYLALSVRRKLGGLRLVALFGTMVAFVGMEMVFTHPWSNEPSSLSVGAALAIFWALVAEFLIAARLAGHETRRGQKTLGSALLALLTAWGILTLFTAMTTIPSHAALPHVFVLVAAVLMVCLPLRYVVVRPIILAEVIFMLGYAFLWHGEEGIWLRWIWIFAALFTADILVRAVRPAPGRSEKVEILQAWLTTASAYLAIYTIMEAVWPSALVPHTLALAGGLTVISLTLYKIGRWSALAETYLLQALSLVLVAVPLYFDSVAATLAWGALGLIYIALAKWRRRPWLLLPPVAAMALAIVKLVWWDIPDDPEMHEVAISLFGVNVEIVVVVAASLGAGLLAMASAILWRWPIVSKKEDVIVAGLLTEVASILLVACAILYLPTTAATWWILVGGVLVLAAGLWLREKEQVFLCAILGAAALFKWMLYDLLVSRLEDGFAGGEGLTAVLNSTWIIGITMAVLLLAIQPLLKRRGLPVPASGRLIMTLLAAFVVLWAGSFEVDRYVQAVRETLHDPTKALHMGLSLWWAVWASVLLAVGFGSRVTAVRYFAIALYAITIIKVFLCEMSDVQAVYRILSFLGLGILLLAASLLYHRYFRPEPTPEEKPKP